jgi:hypothetical protein
VKGFIWVLTLSFLVMVPFGIQAQPKEVTDAVTITYYVTPKTLPLDEGRVRLNYESIGILLSDAGSGLFHGATIHALGGFTVEKGKSNDEQAWGVYNLQNGDKVFFAVTPAGETEPGGGEAKGVATFTGGTGKCAGIRGNITFTRQSLRPALEGIRQVYQKGTMKYTLP